MNHRYQEIVDWMTKRLCMHRIIVVQNNNITNAVATTRNGVALIAYNPNFMQRLSNYSEWAVVMVLGHEVGHHYNFDLHGHFIGLGVDRKSHQRELNAEEISGWLLKCAGANLDQATDIYDVVKFEQSVSHPGQAKRVDTLIKGWREANCQINPPQKVTPSNSNNELAKALLGIAATATLVIAVGTIIRNL